MAREMKTGTAANDPKTGGRVVLVGTYKGDQLEKWRGWYCWPISDDDLKCCQCENVANGQSQLPMPNMGKLETGNNGNGNISTMATLSAVTELWLFRGTAEQKSYKAEFVGVKTREELIRDYGYLFWDACALSWPKAAGTSPFGELQQSNWRPYCGNFGE